MNRWTVIALGVMALVVFARHIERLVATPGSDDGQRVAVADPLGVQVAQADPLPPVESVAPQESSEPDGGALGLPDRAAPTQESSSMATEPADEVRSTPTQRVPLNPEQPLTQERARDTARAQGPLTGLDPHQLLFEPGEPASKPAPPRPRSAQTNGPLTDVDPRQMLFEPGERAPRSARREPPSESRAAVNATPATQPDTAPAAPAESSGEAQTKARIMERLLRVMELAGEKP